MGDGAAEVVAWTCIVLPVVHDSLYPVSSRRETVVAISIEVEYVGLRPSAAHGLLQLEFRSSFPP